VKCFCLIPLEVRAGKLLINVLVFSLKTITSIGTLSHRMHYKIKSCFMTAMRRKIGKDERTLLMQCPLVLVNQVLLIPWRFIKDLDLLMDLAQLK